MPVSSSQLAPADEFLLRLKVERAPKRSASYGKCLDTVREMCCLSEVNDAELAKACRVMGLRADALRRAN